MIVKEAEFHACKTCDNRRRVAHEQYGCDNCKSPIDFDGREKRYLDITIHSHKDAAKHMQLCSWKCAIAKLKNVKTDYFISMPFLHYDEKQKGIRAQDFFAAIKRTRK